MVLKKKYRNFIIINNKKYIWDGKFYDNIGSLNRVINTWENKGYAISFKVVQSNNSSRGKRKYGFIIYKYKY